ncbi:hypothetical protein EYF80_053766 [Liparis tanakae]|uniref:Uncharacterized protein n=1 Tax=Liparis tanakae TaxID=230148 RepID=A0A4Z2F5P6_9TELE|nr:hypothetical protein EYF80_053766 [Liparis tanakae]
MRSSGVADARNRFECGGGFDDVAHEEQSLSLEHRYDDIRKQCRRGGGAEHQGSEHSTGSCESGRRWQLKGQLKEKRSRARLHCCSAEEQTERQGCSTPPRALHWGRNIPHSSRRRGSKHASSISTWTEGRRRKEEEPVSLGNGCVVVSRRHRGGVRRSCVGE